MEQAKEGILSMRVEVPTRETKTKGQEAVEFTYNLHEDVPETLVEEMVCLYSVGEGK